MASHSSISKRRKTAHETCPRKLALFGADLLASVVPYLAVADLTSLSLTCRHFGADSQRGNCDEGASLSLVQEAARRAILNEQSAAERAALVRYPGEGWIAVYHHLLMLRAPLSFDVLLGEHLEYDDGKKSRVIVNSSWSWRSKSAISNHIMRGGKHYAEFSLAQGRLVRVGLMRPIPSPTPSVLGELEEFHPAHLRKEVRLEILQGRSERWGESNIDCCLYNFNSGKCMCSDWEENSWVNHDWEGQEEHFERRGSQHEGFAFSGVLGLLVDLDAGTLTAYKGGRRLGLMCDGLTGEYCWVATISGGAISIKRGAIPNDV